MGLMTSGLCVCPKRREDKAALEHEKSKNPREREIATVGQHYYRQR